MRRKAAVISVAVYAVSGLMDEGRLIEALVARVRGTAISGVRSDWTATAPMRS